MRADAAGRTKAGKWTRVKMPNALPKNHGKCHEFFHHALQPCLGKINSAFTTLAINTDIYYGKNVHSAQTCCMN